jgi:ABC-type nitrate/sulfonate/bicarbonate transport system substrate-binding protein
MSEEIQLNPERAARAWRSIGLLLAIVVVTGAYGHDDTAAQSDTRAVEAKPTLTLASSNAGGLVNGYHSLASVKGFFDKAGVDVKITDNTGANTVNLLVSGRADLATLAWGNTLTLANQGRQTTCVYATAAGFGTMLVGGAGVRTVQDLKGKRIGALARGTTTFGFATHYNQKFNLGADIVSYVDVPTLVAALISGQVAGATATPNIAASMAKGGNTTILIDARDPVVRNKQVGPDYPVGGYIGLTQAVAEKRDAVVRFIRAIEMTRLYVERTSDEQLAKDFRQLDLYKSFSEADLAPLIKSERSFAFPSNGYVSEGNWRFMLPQLTKWGLVGYDSTNPAYEYSKNIDTSFLKAAGVPAGKPVFGKRVTSPSQPVAGKPFTFTLAVNGRYSAQPLTTGTMVANPSVNGKVIKHVESFKNGQARVSFVVPKAAKNKLLSISIKISGSGGTTRVYGFKVR